MLAIDGTVGQIRGVMMRSGSDHGCQDKSVFGINRCMFFNAIVRNIVLNHPVRFDIFRELKGFIPAEKTLLSEQGQSS